jgi:hypothetical protein
MTIAIIGAGLNCRRAGARGCWALGRAFREEPRPRRACRDAADGRRRFRPRRAASPCAAGGCHAGGRRGGCLGRRGVGVPGSSDLPPRAHPRAGEPDRRPGRRPRVRPERVTPADRRRSGGGRRRGGAAGSAAAAGCAAAGRYGLGGTGRGGGHGLDRLHADGVFRRAGGGAGLARTGGAARRRPAQRGEAGTAGGCGRRLDGACRRPDGSGSAGGGARRGGRGHAGGFPGADQRPRPDPDRGASLALRPDRAAAARQPPAGRAAAASRCRGLVPGEVAGHAVASGRALAAEVERQSAPRAPLSGSNHWCGHIV